MEKSEDKTDRKHMSVWIIVGTIIAAGLLIWLLSPGNINVKRKSTLENNVGKTEFTDEGATEFIYNRLKQVNPGTKKDIVKLVIEKEWEWQYANATKTNSNLTLIERTDKRLIGHLVEELDKEDYKLNEEEVKLILKYLEDYEDSLAK